MNTSSQPSDFVDLHSHSTCSDGTLSPTELISLAQSLEIGTIALTDHDTTTGLDEAQGAAEKAGIQFIPGIEIEVDFGPGEFHLLGLGLKNWHQGALPEKLNSLIEMRNQRNLDMLALLQDDGIEADWNDLLALSGGEVIARPHFAELLVNHGWARNQQEAFQKYLTPGQPYYLSRQALTLEEALLMVHQAGGISVLAHPLSLHVSWGRLPEILREWKEMGLQGIEAYHSGARLRDAHRFSALADELGLLISGGSDYHGERRKDRKLGRGPNQMKLKTPFFEPLLAKLLA